LGFSFIELSQPADIGRNRRTTIVKTDMYFFNMYLSLLYKVITAEFEIIDFINYSILIDI